MKLGQKVAHGSITKSTVSSKSNANSLNALSELVCKAGELNFHRHVYLTVNLAMMVSFFSKLLILQFSGDFMARRLCMCVTTSRVNRAEQIAFSDKAGKGKTYQRLIFLFSAFAYLWRPYSHFLSISPLK